MGRGIIDPDDIRSSNPASNTELLKGVTDDFVAHSMDLNSAGERSLIAPVSSQVNTNKWTRTTAKN